MVLDFDTSEKLDDLTTRGMRSIGPRTYVARGMDPTPVRLLYGLMRKLG